MMSIRELAERDLLVLLEDKEYGFGWDISLTSPDSVTHNLIGFSNDISQVVDPDTGQLVSGRVASIVLRISSIYEAGFASLPHNISNSKIKPWIVEFSDINLIFHKFKIISSNPDRSLGIISCMLEAYV